MTDSILFSGSTLNGYCISGTVYLLLPVIAFLLMKRQRTAYIFPVILGVIVYFTAVQFSNLFGNIMGFSRDYAARTVIAAELVRRAVEEIENRGGRVEATCSYALLWLARNRGRNIEDTPIACPIRTKN